MKINESSRQLRLNAENNQTFNIMKSDRNLINKNQNSQNLLSLVHINANSYHSKSQEKQDKLIFNQFKKNEYQKQNKINCNNNHIPKLQDKNILFNLPRHRSWKVINPIQIFNQEADFTQTQSQILKIPYEKQNNNFNEVKLENLKLNQQQLQQQQQKEKVIQISNKNNKQQKQTISKLIKQLDLEQDFLNKYEKPARLNKLNQLSLQPILDFKEIYYKNVDLVEKFNLKNSQQRTGKNLLTIVRKY